MAYEPWELSFTRRTGMPFIEGSDFNQTIEFPILNGVAASWRDFAARAHIRQDFADIASGLPTAALHCTIVDPEARIVNFRLPWSENNTGEVLSGPVDGELYQTADDGTETFVARFFAGRWEKLLQTTTQ